MTLGAFTNAINLIGLAMSLWLGLYVVTRSRSSTRAWLAAAALWVLAAYFFQGALAIKNVDIALPWMRLSILFLIPIWIHLTYLMLPRGLRRNWMAFGFLLLGAFTDLIFGPQIAEPLYTSARLPGPAYIAVYPFFAIGLVILQIQEQEAGLRKAHAPKVSITQWDENTLLPLVEDGFRRLYDYSYLGEQPLGQLRVVEQRLGKRSLPALPTFVDRGKAVSEILANALNVLRPDKPLPTGNRILSREWHMYTILFDSYVQGEPNRDIMSKLYISEGTFHRTRRRALRTVAKTLAEMEGGAEG